LSERTSEAAPHLSFEMKHQLGALEFDVAFELTRPWTVLFGPSGSGKSTVLRAIAGLFRPDSAKIVLRHNNHEQIVADTVDSIAIPSHRRAVRWCGQRSSLFPNMTVLENLRFVAPASGPDGVQVVEALIEQFHLGPLANRRPAMLSGGEQQRASIARTICSATGMKQVALLLFDEPFTGLDTPLRDEIIEDLRCWLADAQIPVLSVTHDIGESFLLGAEIVRIDQGRVIQRGPVAEVLAAERAQLLAQLR
jgi:molybdate transport system ATP-binding protein